MKIHKDEKMVDSINAVLQTKGSKNKSTATNYCVFYQKAGCPTSDQNTNVDKNHDKLHQQKFIDLPHYTALNMPGPPQTRNDQERITKELIDKNNKYLRSIKAYRVENDKVSKYQSEIEILDS